MSLAPLTQAFNNPEKVSASNPRAWKTIVVTFFVVLPVMEGLTRGLVPALGSMHWLLRDVLVVILMSTILTFLLPPIHRRLGPWLAR
jgi:antibiotic biosynthesis monooxygenase (ABM) superfamily enzyme